MSRPARHAVSSLLLLGLLATSCATPRGRCAEYEQALSRVEAGASARDLARAYAAREEVSAIDISEEAALLSKRLKVLCDLVWAQRISYEDYRRQVSHAYQDYERTRIHMPIRRVDTP